MILDEGVRRVEGEQIGEQKGEKKKKRRRELVEGEGEETEGE